MEGAPKTTQSDQENFVTVVSVGPEIKTDTKCDPFTLVDLNNSGYVTVLTIGDSDVPKDIIEEVLVYRLPGERLGFGLKFEGGTKANEYVKRLFIQSCAPDSPASRVQSSWGKLVEGDEVLEIDSMSVNQMTRIDCVRCLKDSNVVIKLLIRHFLDKTINDIKTRSNEDLPLVVSAEKKRTPPPPPPVPPRKIPKKHPKNPTKDQQDNPVPAIRHNIQQSQQQTERKFQSPRSSGRSTQSPDVPRRSRRFSDGSLGPPDAEVYVDLFSQESTQNLSESDDTGSSISTVVDRFSSYPTTTTSSLSGSLPSTPTSIQKHLDFTNFISNFDDDDKIIVKQNVNINKNLDVNEKVVDNDKIYNDDSIPLQPPSCFQDAPLSYGNEDMRIIDNTTDELEAAFNKKNKNINEKKIYRKPPVPPRTIREQQTKLNNQKELHDDNTNMSNLPRLVDFVPKPTLYHDIDIIKDFIENERLDTNYDKDIDIYNSKWGLSSQLATIGEVEEETNQELYRSINSTPVVIVENCDRSENGSNKQQINQNINGNMETPPSDSRQPPDGHEFPDYIETNSLSTNIKFIKINDKNNCVNHKNMNSNNNNNNTNNNNNLQQNSSFNVPINKTLSKMNSVSNSDLTNKDNYELKYRNNDTKLHTRSQSLIDMSTITKRTDRWSQLAEQRRRGLSKLKGLVIPEHISEIEISPTVNIPEIISNTTPIVSNTNNNTNNNNNNNNHNKNQNIVNSSLWGTSETEAVTLPLTTPPWNNEHNSSNLPKYSPAFKRKSLQVYSTATTITKKDDNELVKPQKTITKTKLDEDLRLDNLSDCPKSLESITSPTRSDCSFDYITNTFKNRTNRTDIMDKIKEIPTIKPIKDLSNKSEDESDNDSAVSSSQSSYISRCSPPPSPTRNCELLDYENNKNKNEQLNDNIQCRLLKPASVEAINRKNILASAKCRSGRDLKVGSPIIQRKYDESDTEINEKNQPSDHLERKEEIQLNDIPKEKQDGLSKIQTITNQETNITVICNNNSTEKSQEPIKLRTIKEQPRAALKLDLSKSSILNRNAKSLSVTDLRKNFEKFNDTSPPIPRPLITTPQTPIKDLNKHQSKDFKKINDNHKNGNNLAKIQNKPIEIQESPQNICRKIILCPKFFGGSLGITLAGGTDYETKEITIHKIRYGSVAYNDGQLKKGDKILSINGKSTAGLTHAEAVDMLKEPVDQFVLIVENGKTDEKSVEETSTNRRSSRYESSFDKSSECSSPSTPSSLKSVTHAITLIKDGAGLGFSIEGGKDSFEGDLPIRVKKIFQGGAAGKNGELQVADEILMINDMNVGNLTKIEVWSLMKKLPNGNVTMHIHR